MSNYRKPGKWNSRTGKNFAPGNDWKLRRQLALSESKRRLAIKARLVKKMEKKQDG